jgi:hypothetical protein
LSIICAARSYQGERSGVAEVHRASFSSGARSGGGEACEEEACTSSEIEEGCEAEGCERSEG